MSVTWIRDAEELSVKLGLGLQHAYQTRTNMIYIHGLLLQAMNPIQFISTL